MLNNVMEGIKDILSFKKFKNRIMDYIENYFIVKTMYIILRDTFFATAIRYSFTMKRENEGFIVIVTAEEELVNGKAIRNKTIKFESFVELILNAENIKSSLTKNLIERN